jgi:heme-degrading monooxygenase HmoA
MAYTYLIFFEINREDLSQLKIGSSLERTLGYLKTLLPSEDGFINARAMHSLKSENPTNLIVESTWETWADLKRHMNSSLSENKILKEFEPHVKLEDLRSSIYEDVD